MTQYDVFNGDADGLCSLQQLRLDHPCNSNLVTGVKRDIQLLQRVTAEAGDSVTVLDISFDKNRAAVEGLLEAGVKISYFDHHFPGTIPKHPNLDTHIYTDSNTCTSLIVDAHLKGRFRHWAIVGAFGDNMENSARSHAKELRLTELQISKLQRLGICLNYNGYGSSLGDLYYAPDELFKQIQPFAEPFAFIHETEVFDVLSAGYDDDMARAKKIIPEESDEHVAIYILPAEKWARRVSGVFGNQLAKQAPQRAHAILTSRAKNDGYVVSVRAPLENPCHADTLCRQFPSGGGRKSAAGINHLPETELDNFFDAFTKTYT